MFRSFALVSFILTIPFVMAEMGFLHASPLPMSLLSFAAVGSGIALMASLLMTMKGLPKWIAFVAIVIASLVPDFSIETRYAWLAVAEEGESYASMMLASVNGSSRFLLGVAWPLVIILFWIKGRGARLSLEAGQISGLVLLFMIGLYVFLIFIRGYLWVLDTPIMLLMLIVYLWRLSHSSESRGISETRNRVRGGAFTWADVGISLVIVYGAIVSFAASRFLADGLISFNTGLEASSLLQLTVPVASKLPLLAAIVALVWNRGTHFAVSMLLTSQITLWSVLVGILPVVMLMGGIVSGNLELVWLDDRQRLELLLTSSQAVFAAALMSGKSISWRAALTLFGLFVLEWILSAIQPQSDTYLVQGLFTILYLSGAIIIFIKDRSRLRTLGGAIVSGRGAGSPATDTIPVSNAAERAFESQNRRAMRTWL